MAIKVKNGSWKNASPYIKINGTWKKANHVFIKENGIWKNVDILPVYFDVPAYFYDSWTEGMEHFFDEGNEWHSSDRYLIFSNNYDSDPNGNHPIFNTGETFYVNFSDPPLQGYGSEKICYIWNGGNTYMLENAHTINSGKYKITFTGKVFKVVT